MSESKTARVGLMVLAIAVVAGVGVLVWMSQSDDTAKGAENDERAQKERERAQRESGQNDRKDGDEAKQPSAEVTKTPTAEELKTPALVFPSRGGSLYDRLGGKDNIRAITGKLIEAVFANEVIMANENVRAVAESVNARLLHKHATDFICKATGGPEEYTGRTMKDSHVHLKITAAEWDAMGENFAVVLTELMVPEREAQELLALIGALRDDIVTGK